MILAHSEIDTQKGIDFAEAHFRHPLSYPLFSAAISGRMAISKRRFWLLVAFGSTVASQSLVAQSYTGSSDRRVRYRQQQREVLANTSRESVLTANSFVAAPPGSTYVIPSPNGTYALILSGDDGSLKLLDRHDNTTAWTANCESKPTAAAVLRINARGSLVVGDGDAASGTIRRYTWSSFTGTAGLQLMVFDQGYFGLCTSQGARCYWTSEAVLPSNWFVKSGAVFRSPLLLFRLQFQSWGAIAVIRALDNMTTWTSDTDLTLPTRLAMLPSGNLAVTIDGRNTTTVVWQTGTASAGAYMQIMDDGTLQVYSKLNGTAVLPSAATSLYSSALHPAGESGPNPATFAPTTGPATAQPTAAATAVPSGSWMSMPIQMSGSEVVDGGDPGATGTAWLSIVGAQLCYNLALRNTTGITAGHMHSGADNMTGPVVVDLFTEIPDSATQTFTGCVMAASDVLTRLSVTPQGFYVQVHTQQYAAGAVRGQVAHSVG